MSGIITDVAKYKKGWTGGLPETECGYGSKIKSTKNQRDWIPPILEKYNIKSIADIGAGDLNWIKHVELGDIDYQAFDLVPRHKDVKKFDLLKKVPPKVDLIMCFWVLNHMPKEHCKQAIKNIKKSGAKYLMMTDVERYHKDQPKEILMDHIECFNNGDLLGTIKLIEL